MVERNIFSVDLGDEASTVSELNVCEHSKGILVATGALVNWVLLVLREI